MALVGGGGAGNVAGSNPAGIGSGLNYVGDFTYAYSGPVNASSSTSADTLLLDFTTGSEIIVGTVDFQTTAVQNDPIYLTVLMNGAAVIQGIWDNSGNGQDHADPFNIVIPSFSHIEVKWGIQGGAGADATCQVVGRIY